MLVCVCVCVCGHALNVQNMHVVAVCVFLTLFLPPLGLSSSQVEVEMLCSVSWKGDALPVRRISRSVVLPCLAGPITSIFSSLKGSAFRRCARRKARTEAGPEQIREIKICYFRVL